MGFQIFFNSFHKAWKSENTVFYKFNIDLHFNILELINTIIIEMVMMLQANDLKFKQKTSNADIYYIRTRLN